MNYLLVRKKSFTGNHVLSLKRWWKSFKSSAFRTFISAMKKYILLLTFAIASFYISAHSYFFAHAELEYKSFNSKFELTLSLTAHDLEKAFHNEMLLNEMKTINPVNEAWSDSLCKVINQHFFLREGSFSTDFKLIGSEILANGILNLYMISDGPAVPPPSFEVKFDLFMDHFSEQENKLTFIHQPTNLSLSFNRYLRQNQLILNHE